MVCFVSMSRDRQNTFTNLLQLVLPQPHCWMKRVRSPTAYAVPGFWQLSLCENVKFARLWMDVCMWLCRMFTMNSHRHDIMSDAQELILRHTNKYMKSNFSRWPNNKQTAFIIIISAGGAVLLAFAQWCHSSARMCSHRQRRFHWSKRISSKCATTL